MARRLVDAARVPKASLDMLNVVKGVSKEDVWYMHWMEKSNGKNGRDGRYDVIDHYCCCGLRNSQVNFLHEALIFWDFLAPSTVWEIRGLELAES